MPTESKTLSSHSALSPSRATMVRATPSKVIIPKGSKKYKWGGSSPQAGFDCSGYVCHFLKKNGIPVKRTSAIGLFESDQGKEVKAGALLPGDLVFFQTQGNRTDRNKLKSGYHVSHVGVYIGEGKFVHESSSKGYTTSHLAEYSKYRGHRYLGARRFISASNPRVEKVVPKRYDSASDSHSGETPVRYIGVPLGPDGIYRLPGTI